jgi:hypothetical protein
MSLTSFLNDLFEHGRVATTSADVSVDDQQRAIGVLREFERYDRANWPDGQPEFSEQVGLWSANLLYRACHFVVGRDANPESLERALTVKSPEPPAASAHYSADLSLRFLPDVFKLARAAAADDPLVEMLLNLAKQWPLASVGMTAVRNVDVSCIVRNPCLLQMYVDRLISRSDLSRLNHPTVREAAQASLGLYPDLAPAISAEIERLVTEERPA